MYCQTTSQESPLNDETKRQIHSQLLKLRDLIRLTIPEYETKIIELQELVAKEQSACTAKVSAEQQLTKVAADERNIYKDKLTTCEASLKVCSKKPGGVGCFFKKFFSLWLARCK